MKKYKPYLTRVDLVKNQVERERIQEQEAAKKRKHRIQQQNRQRHLRYQEQLRSELAARYFHGVMSAGGESFSNTKSLEFDGIDDYVGLTTIILSGAFSISAWVNFSTLSSAESHIINTGTSNTNRIGVYDANDFQIKIAGTNVFISETGGNDFVTNQWQHVLVTRDASNNVSVFRNGASFGSSTTLSGTLTLDSIFRFNTSQYSVGYCDELAIWNSDQSSNASTFGASPIDLSTYSPLHWWRFEGTGTTATDSGTGGNDGTINGATRDTDVPS